MYIYNSKKESLTLNIDLVVINMIEPRAPCAIVHEHAIVHVRAMTCACTSAQGSDVTWHPYDTLHSSLQGANPWIILTFTCKESAFLC